MDEMLQLVAALPDQLDASADLVAPVEVGHLDGPRYLVVVGMGGSAAAANLLGGLNRQRDFWLDVVRDYTVAPRQAQDSLVVFSSYSGNTEEVLSCYDAMSTSRRLVISSGGALTERARADGVACVALPGGLPPRASLGYGLGALGGCIEKLGWLADFSSHRNETIDVLRAGNERLGAAMTTENPAHDLARRLYGKLPVLYAARGLTRAVADRAQAQINENSKSLCHVASLPEMNHNEVVGWEGSATVNDCYIVALRDAQDHPRVQRRFEITQELLMPAAAGWETVHAAGRSELARLMSLVQFFDYLSVYLAGQYGQDPVAVRSIDQLKARLSESS